MESCLPTVLLGYTIVTLSTPCISKMEQTPLECLLTHEVCYRSDNLVTKIHFPDSPTEALDLIDYYTPRTELGRRLLALRRVYLEGGGRLLSQEEVLESVHRLRAD